MQIINWGIIGCGDVTEVKSGPAFNKVSNSKLIAVMRRDAEKAKDYAARHGIPKWYSNARELIDDPEVNAVYVATPPLSHEEYAIKALQAGKPVYLEKPMAVDLKAAERIAAIAKETGVKFSVAHYRRQQPIFLKIKSLIVEKAIGEVRLVNLQFYQPHLSNLIGQPEENWRLNPAISGGGLFHDLAPHQLDLMIYYFGRSIYVSGVSFNAAGLYKAPDTVSGQIIFENKILFNGCWSFTINEKRDFCEIIGTEGKISCSIFEHKALVITKNGEEETIQFDKLQHVQQPMIQKVVEYFLDLSPNPCSAEEGLSVMRLIDSFTTQASHNDVKHFR